MATELIAAAATNTYDDGAVEFPGGRRWSPTGPTQDIMDQMTANTFDTFLGMTHVNCLLCHNGRGHLDALSLWAHADHALPGVAACVLPVAHQHGAHAGGPEQQQHLLLVAAEQSARTSPRITR